MTAASATRNASPNRRARLFGFGAAVFALATLLVAPAGGAGSFASSAPPCEEQVYGQPFRPWADPAHYVIVPNGHVESTRGWALSGAARRVRDNEPFYVNNARDRYSLLLASGDSGTTRPLCVGLLHPTLRFFVRNTGTATAVLKVEVLFENVLGLVEAAKIGAVTGGGAWMPTPPLLIAMNTMAPLSSEGTTAAAFRFTPVGAGARFQLDDVYVDPYRSR
jgi:hypothetical protein